MAMLQQNMIKFWILIIVLCMAHSTWAFRTRLYKIQYVYLESENGEPVSLAISTDSTQNIVECEIKVFGFEARVPGSAFGEYQKYYYNGISLTRYIDIISGKTGFRISFTRGDGSRIWEGFSLVIFKDMNYLIEPLKHLCPRE